MSLFPEGEFQLVDPVTQRIQAIKIMDKGTFSLADVEAEIVSTAPMDTPVLPIGDQGGTVAYGQNKSLKIFWVQRPEMLLNIEYHNESTGSKRAVTIAWPWQLYCIVCERFTPLRVAMFFTKGPITKSSDTVYYTPMPNSDDNGTLCVGYEFTGFISKAISYDDMVRKTIYWLATATLNHELTNSARKYAPVEFQKMKPKAISGPSELFDRWTKWTDDAKEKNEWRSINRLDWIPNAPFKLLRERIRS